jgi:murein biosynthesis integral membrane protein MurJ
LLYQLQLFLKNGSFKMSQDTGVSQHTGTTSAYLASVRLKSAVNKRIFRALLSLASAALLIRVMGMFNQIVVSSRFGLGSATDAYFVASLVPSLLATLISSAVEYSVIPVYIRILSQRGRKQASKLFSTLLNILLVGTVLLTVVMFIFRSLMIRLSAPGLDSFSTQLATSLAPFIFPSLVLMVVISLLECTLNAEGQFGWPAYAGMLVPLATMILVLVAGQSLGIVTLCLGIVIGLCLQLCAFIIRAHRAKLIYRPTVNLRDPEVRSILIAAWPAFLSALIIQASPLVDQIFASSLSAGSISALNYALKLNSVPVGVIFVSVGRAALPYLSYQVSTRDMKTFKETLRLYLWVIGIGTFIFSAVIIVLAHPLVRILFQRGAFSAADTNLTTSTLIGFTLGLTPTAFGFILSKAFNALGKTRILMYVTTFSVIANAVFDYIFARLWQSMGIALATTAVYFCTMFILLFALNRTIGKLNLFTPPGEIVKVIWKLGAGKYYVQWIMWKQKNPVLFNFPNNLRRQIVRLGIVIVCFITGAIGVFLNPLYTLRAAFGSLIVLAFLRYHYVLLIAWVLLGALIGSNIPIFNGNNLLSGLTVPTLLLMLCMPVKQSFKRAPVLAFLSIYLLWVFVGIGISAIGFGAFLTTWTTFLDYVAISVLTINVITTRERMLRLIDAILILSTFISLYGIYGYITRQNGALDATASFRIFSIFSAAPALALFLSVVIPLALYRTFTLRGYKCVGGLILIFVFLVTLGLTFSRGTFISVPLSIILMIFLLPSPRLKMGLLSGIFVLTALVVLLTTVGHVPLFDRFFSQDIGTFNGRTELWQVLFDHFDPAQLLGNGLHASDVLLANTGVGVLIATSPSNLFLGTLYDHGIIGLILLTLVFITLLISLIAGVRKTTGEHRMLFAAALAVFVSVSLQSFESNDFWAQGIAIYFWIMMALPFAYCWLRPTQSSETREETLNEDTDDELKEETLVKDMDDEVREETLAEDTDNEVTKPRMRAIQQGAREQVSKVRSEP